MTPEEKVRLLEWARRAMDGRRYIRPKGDNVRELLGQVAQDYPQDPGLQRLRRRLRRQLDRDTRRALRRKQTYRAERWLKAWVELFADDKTPRQRLAYLDVRAGRKALARRRYRIAAKRAHKALEWVPEGAAALELRADVAYRRRRFARAVQDYERALGSPLLKNRWRRRRLRRKLKRAKRRAR